MNNKGISLIEVLVVVAIGGILLALALNDGSKIVHNREFLKRCQTSCMPYGVKTFDYKSSYCTCDLSVKQVQIGN